MRRIYHILLNLSCLTFLLNNQIARAELMAQGIPSTPEKVISHLIARFIAGGLTLTGQTQNQVIFAGPAVPLKAKDAIALRLFGNPSYLQFANNSTQERYIFTVYPDQTGTTIILQGFNVLNPSTPIESPAKMDLENQAEAQAVMNQLKNELSAK